MKPTILDQIVRLIDEISDSSNQERKLWQMATLALDALEENPSEDSLNAIEQITKLSLMCERHVSRKLRQI